MNRIQSHLWRSYLDDTFSMDNGYYRVQKSSLKCDDLKIGLLHCPFSKRQWISTARFSLPGVPSTYMSTMPALAWYESRMPTEYYIARYYINPDMYHKYSLLYLDYDLQFWTRKWSQAINHDKDLAGVHKTINDILHTIPLIAACSFATSTENCNFREEYIIPQMLMSWIKQNTDMIGILFSSSSPYDKSRDYNARNLVIPARDFGSDGYCKFLKSIFIHNDSPRISEKNVAKEFEGLDAGLNSFREFSREIKSKLQTTKHEEMVISYGTMSDLCQIVLHNFETLRYSKAPFLDREKKATDAVMNLISDIISLYAEIVRSKYTLADWVCKATNLSHELSLETASTLKNLILNLQKLQSEISETERQLFL